MDDTSSSRSSPTPSDRRLAVARILGAKGLAGALRVELVTDWPERLTVGADLWLEGESEPMRIAALQTGGRVPVLQLDGVTTRDAAEALAGRYLELGVHELPPEAYYWDDIVGLRVEEPDGTEVGELTEIFRAGGNEVYLVTGPHGERLIPALRSAVLRIDLETGLMVVAPDESVEVG
ncbi:MAG: ribosome maturation factor RimM [Candidatus Limnocylindria bacterium]